jgi:cell wall-associated NlpC family hydrolase
VTKASHATVRAAASSRHESLATGTPAWDRAFALRLALAGLIAVAAAAPAQARTAPALRPGEHAAIDVSVATLWKAPNLARGIDRPSLTNPADPAQWSRNLATTASRLWLDAHVQTQALYGQQVVVLARRGTWAQVAVVDEPDPQNPHGYPGWLPASQLARDFDRHGAPLVVTERTGTLHVAGRTLRLSYGTTLPSLGADRVRTPDGIGVLVGATRPLSPSNASIIAQARRFLGTHYLWGGLSTWGFDCSGLVWDVYRAHGLTIPRDADPQFHHGTSVARADLRPGDLLFFGSPTYAEHVAIYVGDDRMLEAPDSADRVRIVPVRWTYYIGARRYLTR